jgi:uncharacterized membrane protein YphA (DoxX/SURF4 family)
MHRWPRWGRFLFAATAAALGAQHLLRLAFAQGLEPVPAWVPLQGVLAFLYGLTLLLGGVALLVGFRPRLGTLLLAIPFLLMLIVLELPLLVTHITSGSAWTRTFETLAMAAAAVTWVREERGRTLLPARIAFGLSLIVFGVLHFTYLEFTGTLVPAWIPARVFWAGFVGACFLAAGSAIVSGVKAQLAAIWTGVMFTGFILLLHIPLVASHVGDPGLWTSMFVAMLMAGGAWIVVGTSPSRLSDRG